MKILVLNGPNMNLLGLREPGIYGSETLPQLEARLSARAEALGAELSFFQSNHEGALTDAIQQAFFDGTDGLIFNPAAYTHTSIALPDALRATGLPCVEVHISDPDAREPYRQANYIREACLACVKGRGTDGYLDALELLCEHLRGREA